jgi:hypothetical protein
MTTLVLNYSQNLFEAFCEKLNSTFDSFGKAIRVSRQLEANRQIARWMLHEYKDHTYESLLAELNFKTLQDIYNDK